jgi:hypothetical protein
MTHQNRTLQMLEFDDIDAWAPSLKNALQAHVSEDAYRAVATSKPEYIEDALETFFGLTDRDAIIHSTLSWVESKKIIGFHGTRLTDKEIASVLLDGLVPLAAGARRERLIRALSRDPNWSMVEGRLDEVIDAHGEGNTSGHRQGQIHLTLSEAGLVGGFNHYLTHGSEFDQHVAFELLGQAGQDYLARDGVAILFRVAVPGPCALEAAHPFFTVEDACNVGEVPNIVKEFLSAWTFHQTDQSFRPTELKVDCGMIFKSTIPPEWIINHKTVSL